MVVVPKRAVVCMVMRDESEVLLGRRNDSMKFMAGHHVFPGGRVDDDEGTNHVVDARDAEHAADVHAAAREAFEEVGVLCAEGAVPGIEARREAQRELLEERVTFDGILERFSLTLKAEDFEPAGHWVTPEESPIRFSTRYHLYRLRQPQEACYIDGEFVTLDWFTAREARSLWRQDKIELSAPVSLTLEALAALPYPDFLEILCRRKAEIGGSPNRFEVHCGVSIVPLETRTIPPATRTNCVLVGEKELYVVDPGADEAGPRAYLNKQIDLLVEMGASLKAVLLTHSHGDHTVGAPFLREHYGVPIWGHEATAAQVGFPLDRHLVDGEILASAGDPDWRLRVIHTPGHDPGHLCYLEESTGALLCGDMVANPGTIMISLGGGGDMTQFIESLEKLRDLDSTTVVPAHGMPLDKAREFLQWHIDHRLWREGKIKDALEQGLTTLDKLLPKAYDDVPSATYPLAEQSLKAHLARLGVTLDG